MKVIILVITMITTLGIPAGCAGNKELVNVMGTSTTRSVFQEVEQNVPAAHGYADLRINSYLKTHNTSFHSVKDTHGTPDYKMLLNIDGQTVLLRGSVQMENSEPRGLADPEAGEGIRYRFNKSLRLKAGTHRIVVAIPDDGIAVAREITLVEGNGNNLVLEPIYKTTPGMRRPGAGSTTSFKEGIRGFRLTLNGRNG
jgi:hypothetical protein